MEVFKHTDINVTDISYTKPEKQQKIYYSSISYKDDYPLHIKTSKMKFIEIKEESNQKYLIVEMNENDFSIYDLLIKIDDNNLSSTHVNSEDWFNKEIPIDVFENQYKRITKPFNKDELPRLKIKIPFRHKILCNVYDSYNNLLQIDQLSKNNEVMCIIHIKGLKFLKEYFYCDCYVSQIKLCHNFLYNIPKECLIDDDKIKDNRDKDIIDEDIIKQEEEKSKILVQIKDIKGKIESDKKTLGKLHEKFHEITNNF